MGHIWAMHRLNPYEEAYYKTIGYEFTLVASETGHKLDKQDIQLRETQGT